jgi:hypothetical protein
MLAAACNAQDKQSVGTQAAPGSANADPALVHHPEPPPQPSEKQDSIPLEGTYNRFTAKLVQPQAEPRFSTYVPADMLHEPTASGEGDGHFFFTNFAGQRNPNAYLLVFIYPAGTTEARARASVESFVASRKALERTREAGPRYREALLERDFSFEQNGVHFFGSIALGKHAGRYFHLAHQYPEGFSEGFEPRAEYIRRQWVWLDDGQGLGLTSPLPPGSPR